VVWFEEVSDPRDERPRETERALNPLKRKAETIRNEEEGLEAVILFVGKHWWRSQGGPVQLREGFPRILVSVVEECCRW
jgi:hypothetical protein